jgi:hypothetical protein
LLQVLFILSAFCDNFEKYLKGQLLYRQIIALLFLTAFLAQSLSKPFIIVDYYTNTGKYAKNCENKARPKMHCNGKCQMMKKLQEEEKKDQENQERKSENKNEVVLSSKSFFISDPNYSIRFIKRLYPTLQSPKETDCSFEVFHPPRRSIEA